ncbi:MAG: acyl carrier protein [Ignavibacteriaceae bacterium]|nr:acyl carrier protein [Ignavibacteriaceae bacterium]HRI47382.1 acyl carrier protein [Ignavibacteriaceae bacterium]
MISEKLANVISTELKLQSFNFTDETTADQVPGWDSLSHLNIIVAIEKEFAVKFKGIEILRTKNLGDLQRLIDSKLG